MFGLMKISGPAYSTEQLIRPARGRVDRWAQELRHRNAMRGFEHQRRVSPKPLESAFPDLSKTRVTIQDAVPTSNSAGNAGAGEIVILSSICAYLRPRLIVEFGTFDGLTALHLAINSPPEARVVTVDLHPEDPIRKQNSDDTFYTRGVVVGEHFHETPEADKIQQVYCDSTQFDVSPYEHKANFIFVDAGHAYDLVRSDSLKSLQMIAPGGAILWHDYHYVHPGVYRWLNELSGQIPLFQIPGTTFVCHVSPSAGG